MWLPFLNWLVLKIADQPLLEPKNPMWLPFDSLTSKVTIAAPPLNAWRALEPATSRFPDDQAIGIGSLG
jgi:hypothetical protein